MTFTMATEDTFTQMAIITWVIGSTGSGLAGVNWSTSQAKYMKACGSIVNSQEVEIRFEHARTRIIYDEELISVNHGLSWPLNLMSKIR